MVAVPIVRYGSNHIFNTNPSLSTSGLLLTAGVGIAFLTFKSLALLGIPPTHRLFAMTVGTCAANLIDGLVFSLFPEFYSDGFGCVRSAGHILWVTSWGLVFACF
jgi:hypothetical protein